MRSFMFGFLVLAVGFAVVAPGHAQVAKGKKGTKPVVDTRPDLSIANAHRVDQKSVFIPVINRGASNAPACTIHVAMYRTINGIPQIVATGSATVPAIRSGDLKNAIVNMNQPITNCTLEIRVDSLSVINEANEQNNTYRAVFK